MINRISYYGTHYFYIRPRTSNLQSTQISKSKSLNHLHIMILIKLYFWNKLPNQMKNRDKAKTLKIELND